MSELIVLTGCSGGGKSTLLDALAARGHATVPEPGRRIVRRERETGGNALPWSDGPAFARACIAMALDDLAGLPARGPVFFDRSWLDAAIWLERRGHAVPPVVAPRAYDRAVLFPPWPELFVSDAERRHPLAEAVEEYETLATGYPARGVPAAVIPKLPVEDRIAWLSGHLGLSL